MTDDGNNIFSADFPSISEIGTVEYYYDTYFEDDVTIRKVNHPRYGSYSPKLFLLGPDIFAPETGDLLGSIATITEDMILDLQLFDSNDIDFVRGIYTIDGVTDSVEMTPITNKNRELNEYHYTAAIPARAIETYGTISFRMNDDQGNISLSDPFDIAWLNQVIEDFETGDFSKIDWTFAGDLDWTIDNSEVYEGVYSAKSASITDNQTTTLEVELEVGDGDLSFYYKVSSENNYDFFRFFVDGVEVTNWSGEVTWSEYTTTLTEGTHVFKWIYEKDNSVSSGSDCAWIDYISFPPVIQVNMNDNYELQITNYELKQNYPNPFNPITKIRYRLPVETMHASSLQPAEIVVYNAAGQQVWSSPITDHSLRVTGSVLFDGSKFNSGVYYYSLIVDGKKLSTKSMVLIK